MSLSQPSSASLLAQSLGARSPSTSDVEPLRDSSSPIAPVLSDHPGEDPALPVRSPPVEMTPREIEIELLQPPKSWVEVLAGEQGSWRREISWIATAVVLQTVVRSVCFAKPIFGAYFLANLAPLEREGVRWYWIVLVRFWEVVLGGWVWRRVRGDLRGDGALFGLVFALVSRISLYAFEHSYFLLSAGTVSTLLLVDAISFFCAFSLLRPLLPHSVLRRPVLSAWDRIRSDRALILNVLFGLGVATFGGAAGSYVLERMGGREFVKANVWDATVPSYIMKDQLTASQMLAVRSLSSPPLNKIPTNSLVDTAQQPSIPVPTLRTFSSPLSMPHHLLQSLLVSLSTLPLVSVLPSLSPVLLSLLTFTLILIPSSILLFDVLPISPFAALGVGLALALRGAWAAGIVSWTIEELRKVKTSRTVALAVLDVETDEVLAVVRAKVEVGDDEDAHVGKTTPRRRGVIRGEIEL
ncbi:SPOSA6832_02414 [Sporobolomyces salmonicolor]|uniref:SPOSA6832_02414-mRNA-1:cds n=1 Tax=Sporidiobolus salmonicolor TaxID=5005 RepID=A0A0D6EMB2_SPOSA|nr:SPOSA6832_02414 [Sporobolomyces salmonicolor]